jgi:transcriptional regulator GlxA family with amidase domain
VLGRRETTRRIGSVCSGALVLAATGLLDGRRATTHWAFCNLLAERHPEVTVEPDAILVAEPPLYTFAGVTAGIDLALSLVEGDCGPGIAMSVARDLMLFMRRGGPSPFRPALRIQTAATPALQHLMAEFAAYPRDMLGVADLAARAGMSERNFSRQLKKQTGMSPSAFVQAVRVETAKALPERTDWSLPRVAERSGFGSVDSLHRAFQARPRTTPIGFRQRFGRAIVQASEDEPQG